MPTVVGNLNSRSLSYLNRIEPLPIRDLNRLSVYHHRRHGQKASVVIGYWSLVIGHWLLVIGK
jgi:hypothetical protein